MALTPFANLIDSPPELLHGQNKGMTANCLSLVHLGRVNMVFWILWACALATAALGAEYKVGQKFQIILSNVVVAPSNTATKIRPTDAAVFDVDAFETDASTIALLQAQGKIVICYFSAGTYEPYRSDSGSFTASDKGHNLPEWPDEYWLKVTSANVRKIMTSRIQMAAAKGCDGVDPDNTGKFTTSTI